MQLTKEKAGSTRSGNRSKDLATGSWDRHPGLITASLGFSCLPLPHPVPVNIPQRLSNVSPAGQTPGPISILPLAGPQHGAGYTDPGWLLMTRERVRSRDGA